MTLSPTDIDAAAMEVVRDKLAAGIAHPEVEMILHGQPGYRIYSVEELRQVRERVHLMFRAYAKASIVKRVA